MNRPLQEWQKGREIRGHFYPSLLVAVRTERAKCEFKVGREAEGHITVTMTDGEPKREFSLKKAAVVIVVAAILAGTLASVVYGMATGDYSAAYAIAEAGKQLVEVAVKIAVKGV